MVGFVLRGCKFEVSRMVVKANRLTPLTGWVDGKEKPGACSTRLEIRKEARRSDQDSSCS